MNYITGKIKHKFATQPLSDKFSKREFVITTDDKYPQQVLLQLINDNCNKLDAFKIGDHIKAFYNIKGREWISPQGEAKYFVTIESWKIEKFVETTTPKVESSGDVNDEPF